MPLSFHKRNNYHPVQGVIPKPRLRVPSETETLHRQGFLSRQQIHVDIEMHSIVAKPLTMLANGDTL
jgi:hypothetical protein